MSVLLSIITGGVFFLLLLAIDGQREAADDARRSRQVLVAANQLELVLVDIQRGQRGFVITGQDQFLQPWRNARASYPGAAAALQRLAVNSGDDQGARAAALGKAVGSFINRYSVPLVDTAQRDLAAARAMVARGGGERATDAIHERFARFEAEERSLLAQRQAHADADARLATVAASVGAATSVALVLLSGAYLARMVVRPVRRASAMADRVAGGDLSARMPETGPGEVGVLQRAFNAMAGSLQTSDRQLRRVADQQAALRRVATLVARGVPPPEVFAAVAAETGGVLGATSTAVARYEPDGAAVVAGSWGESAEAKQSLPIGSRWPGEPGSLPEQVLRTGQAAERAACAQTPGVMAVWARRHGIHSAVASPVFVAGRIWGLIIAFSGGEGLRPGPSQARMLAFTELVAMAVANSESTAQLAASRARVVAAADDSRRRIERDLHDGTQQRLISLALEMRAASARFPAGQDRLRAEWDRAAQAVTEVSDELREISRGLHPAILETGGLGPALRVLARRSAVPADLAVSVADRLPERVEIAAYYVVSEALTNAAKHAHASHVRIEAAVTGGILRLLVADDGEGGADPGRGSGLTGLSDRVEALGGRLEIVSPPGGGTSLLAMIPVPRRQAGAAGGPG